MNRFHLNSAQAAAEPHESLHLEHAITARRRTERRICITRCSLRCTTSAITPIRWSSGCTVPGMTSGSCSAIMPLVSMRNYVSIGPRGPRPCASGGTGYTWSECEADVTAAEDQRLRVPGGGPRRNSTSPPHRVFLAGYQAGGTMAFRLGLKYPRKIRRRPVAGRTVSHREFARSRISTRRVNSPCSLPRVATREWYPVETTCQELRLFHAAGMHVTLRQYPCGDELNPQMLHDMNVWIMEQVTGVTTTETESLSPQVRRRQLKAGGLRRSEEGKGERR